MSSLTQHLSPREAEIYLPAPIAAHNSLLLPGKFRRKEFTCLADTGAWNFIDHRLVNQLRLHTTRLDTPLVTRLHDGSRGHDISRICHFTFTIRSREITAWFLVSRTDDTTPVTLGLPWFRTNLPHVVAEISDFGKETEYQNTSPHDTSTPSSAYLNCLRAGGGEVAACKAAVEQRIDQLYSEQCQELQEINAHGCATGSQEVEIPHQFRDFLDVFDPDLKNNPIQPKHGVTFRIRVDDQNLPPPATRNIPRSPDQLLEEKKQLDHMLDLQLCRTSSSSTAAPSFFVKKACDVCHQLRCSCGARAHPQRWVIDFRRLNDKEPQIAYPIPVVRDLLADVAGHKRYIKFDIVIAFNHVPIAEDDKHKSAFLTSFGLYEMNVMTFGFKNAPAYFQRMMDSILAPVRHFCRAFFDDGILWADNDEELTKRFLVVLQLLRDNGLRLKLPKCEFFKDEVHYLGHLVSQIGIRSDPAKVQAIKNWPEPLTKTDIKGFLGLTSYYRPYFPNFAKVAAPLHELTKNDCPTSFPALPDSAKAAFTTIKNYWSDPRHLAVYNSEKDTDLFTDASSEAWGGAVEQAGQPLAFGSGKFDQTQRRWPTIERELFACLQMHRKFPHLLRGRVTWWTDHKALEQLRSTLALSPKRINWSNELDNFPFIVRHKPGKDLHVDGMTRHSTYPKDAGFGGTDPVLSSDRFDTPEAITTSARVAITNSDVADDVKNYILTCISSYALQNKPTG